MQNQTITSNADQNHYRGVTMNKLKKTLITLVNEYEGNDKELVEVLETHSRVIDYAETIEVTLCQEEAELISKVGLEWIDNFTNGDDEWDFYRDKAFK